MEKEAHILIVEDESALAELVRDYLVDQGFTADIEANGLEAARRIVLEKPDLVLLDLMIPGMDGMSVCRKVRSAYSGPIIIVTASQDDLDQVVGLEIGADDYVMKPVVPRVLLARIRAALRRAQPVLGSPEKENTLTFGDVSIDGASRELHFRKEVIELTGAEFDLLWMLACRHGEVQSRDSLLQKLRGFGYDGFDRSVDLRLSRLRAKLSVYPDLPVAVKTIHGKGYLFAVVA